MTNPIPWVMSKLFPVRPTGVLTLREVHVANETMKRKQHDALPCMRDFRQFSAAAFIRNNKWMPTLQGRLTGGVK